MTIFYAEIDTEENYGWDLTDSTGPPTPPGKKLTPWENLKSDKGKKNRVRLYAQYMLSQEAAAKGVAPLANRACDYVNAATKKSKISAEMKQEEVVECKEKVGVTKTGLASLFGAWFNDGSDDDVEDLVEGATVAINDLDDGQKKLRAIVCNLQKKVGGVAAAVHVVDEDVKAVNADLQAFKANHEADVEELRKQFNDFKLGHAPKQNITSGRVRARKQVTINVVPVEEE